jgi:hypothetical protein
VELLAHIAVLVVITVIGSAIAARRIERLLLT